MTTSSPGEFYPMEDCPMCGHSMDALMGVCDKCGYEKGNHWED